MLACRVAGDELRPKHDLRFSRPFFGFYHAAQRFSGERADPAARLSNGCQLDLRKRCEINVVKSDDAEAVRNRAILFGEILERAQRDQVVSAEETIRSGAASIELFDGPVPAFDRIRPERNPFVGKRDVEFG